MGAGTDVLCLMQVYMGVLWACREWDGFEIAMERGLASDWDLRGEFCLAYRVPEGNTRSKHQSHALSLDPWKPFPPESPRGPWEHDHKHHSMFFENPDMNHPHIHASALAPVAPWSSILLSFQTSWHINRPSSLHPPNCPIPKHRVLSYHSSTLSTTPFSPPCTNPTNTPRSRLPLHPLYQPLLIPLSTLCSPIGHLAVAVSITARPR